MHQAGPKPIRSPGRVVRFGPNELDLTQYELRRAGARLRLARLPLDLLIILVERAGQLVTREEIVELLWPDKALLVDMRAGVNNAINRLRSVLNDDADTPRYIETVIGRGYRFIAACQVESATPPIVGTPVLTSQSVHERAGMSRQRSSLTARTRVGRAGCWCAAVWKTRRSGPITGFLLR